MKRRTIYDLHKAAKAELAELRAQVESRNAALAQEADAHRETRLRMERYERDASEARRLYHERDKEAREAQAANANLRVANERLIRRDEACAEFLDGIEGAINMETAQCQHISAAALEEGSSRAGIYYHKPSSNSSVAARLGAVLSRVLRQQA